MKKQLFRVLALALVATWIAGARASGAAAPAKTPPPACGVPMHARDLVEPPDVEVWKLPPNANGEHELILSVYGDESEFCYRYELDGVAQKGSPTIRARRGDHFALRIVNDIAGPSPGEKVASTAIPACRPMAMPDPKAAHYVGYLNHTIDDEFMRVPPVDTNVHLHGFQGAASQENVFLSTLSTPMHACEYHITVPRTQPPGLYLYHPHAHGTSDDEVALGLDGVWIVEPDQREIPRSAEHVIVLRYRLPVQFDNMFVPDQDAFVIDAAAHEAALHPAPPIAYDPFNPPPWPVTSPMMAGGVTLDPTGCNGLGSEPLVALNGVDAPASLGVPAGETQLLRIMDGTSDSAKVIQLRDSAGRVQPLRVAGFDGVPVSGDMAHPLAQYVAMNDLVLTSMSRADVLVTLKPGERLTLSSEHYCQGRDGFFQMRHKLLKIDAVAATGQGVALDSKPVAIADTPAARLVAFARANPSAIRRRAITFTEYVFPKKGKTRLHQAYYLTDTTNSGFHEHPYWPAFATGATVPSNPDIVVRKGTIEEWYLINATMETHAFHIHQMTLVQERSPEGMPLTGDTAFVGVGKLLPNRADPNYPLIKPRITKILLDFRHVPRGTFVVHCHMLFHEDHGMMATIQVV